MTYIIVNGFLKMINYNPYICIKWGWKLPGINKTKQRSHTDIANHIVNNDNDRDIVNVNQQTL